MRSRHASMVVAIASVAALLSACGGSSPGPSGGGSSPGTQQGGSSDVVSTAQASGVGSVIVNTDGSTLYYLKTDAQNAVTCTGGCAQTWPPDIVTGTPTDSSLPGTLGTIANPAGGRQLTYDGWPLYTYAGDSAPGQANGEGIGGVWFAMSPDGATGGSGGATESTGSSGGGRY